VINSGGIKIYPEMVENKLASVITNNRFFIASVPDDKLGQKIVIVVESTGQLNKKEIIAQIGNILSKYEKPKEYFRVDRFLETPTGKVKKEETLKIAKKF
jgi:O-succinylbenzoic acid--CoA ligase